MSESGSIDSIIGITVTEDGRVREDEVNREHIDVVQDDVIGEMREVTISMKATIESQDKRLAQLEVKVERLKMNEDNDRPRSTVTMPKSYVIRHTTAPNFGAKDRSADSSVDFDTLSASRSVISSPTAVTTRESYLNRGGSAAALSMRNPLAFKNTSAIGGTTTS